MSVLRFVFEWFLIPRNTRTRVRLDTVCARNQAAEGHLVSEIAGSYSPLCAVWPPCARSGSGVLNFLRISPVALPRLFELFVLGRGFGQPDAPDDACLVISAALRSSPSLPRCCSSAQCACLLAAQALLRDSDGRSSAASRASSSASCPPAQCMISSCCFARSRPQGNDHPEPHIFEISSKRSHHLR
jgi:hypothetical protein